VSGEDSLEAIADATSHIAAARATTGPLSVRSASHPPAKTPASSATVPPTVAIEFAISRSSVGTSLGTTVTAVAR
jgi:hypothetical protein